MKNLIYVTSFSLIFLSCGTSQLYMSVTEPAPVTVPAYIKRVGVIDRSKATDETKIIDVVDKAFSLEGANLDKEGAAESINGLTEELLNNDRFIEVKALSVDFRTPRLASFPIPLTWDIVDQVCRESGIDALFALEKFDTDTKIGYSNRKVDIKTPLGMIPGIEHLADMSTLVKTGWRIYDPKSRTILDEFIYNESISFSGQGINPALAAAGLLNRKEAVKQVSNKAGHGYALRIIPVRIRVWRDYYGKGSNNLKIAKRKAQVGKWDEAGELWFKETENPRKKVAKRATYNMAIINEINGDLNAALKWAQKSYEDYRNKLALEYVNILENRMYKNQILKEQETR
jgi:hypothetical protein